MQNINTTYSPYNQQAEDSIVTIPLKSFAPKILLKKTGPQTGCLIYSIIFLIIFAIIRLRGKNLFFMLWNVILKKKRYELILNEGITQNLIYYFFALSLSFSALAISLTYLAINHFDFTRICYVLLFLWGWHLYCLSIITLCSWIFNLRIIGEEASINLWVYHICGGLLISPFILSAFFVKTFAIPLLIKTIVSCLILFYLVKLFRWIKIFLAYNIRIFYMILYLCALEVMPLSVLYRILT
ncbi:DUF4271 domain-containing protein [Odoribacter lunatus]|uniref:DUF4271 domain-containing protein n=1 Tax=Odoribacter lunatus TaxID=2941335 RepID=UPI003B972CE8